jgi:hypothetical protein
VIVARQVMLVRRDQRHQEVVLELQDHQDQKDVQEIKVPPVKLDLKALPVMQAHQEKMHNTVHVQIAVVLHLVLHLLTAPPNNNIHHKK